MKVIAVYNVKGGVGKTATAVNLSYLSARDGARTLVWDLDPQGAASFYFRVRPEVRGGGRRLLKGGRGILRRIRGTDYELLDLLPSDLSYRHFDLLLSRLKKPVKRLRRTLARLGEAYDIVFLDCAPGLSLVSEGIFAAADALVVPTIPTTLSLRTLELLQERLASMKRRALLLPFFCMVDLRKSLHREICNGSSGSGDAFLRARVPYSSKIERMGTTREPLEVFAGRTAPAQSYRDLWREIAAQVVEAGA